MCNSANMHEIEPKGFKKSRVISEEVTWVAGSWKLLNKEIVCLHVYSGKRTNTNTFTMSLFSRL